MTCVSCVAEQSVELKSSAVQVSSRCTNMLCIHVRVVVSLFITIGGGGSYSHRRRVHSYDWGQGFWLSKNALWPLDHCQFVPHSLATPFLAPVHCAPTMAGRPSSVSCSWPLIWCGLVRLLDCLTASLRSAWPLDPILTPVVSVDTVPMGVTSPWLLNAWSLFKLCYAAYSYENIHLASFPGPLMWRRAWYPLLVHASRFRKTPP